MKLIPTQTALAASASISSPLRDNVIERIKSATFRLEVTAAALVVGDTLDVYIQHRPQRGTDGGAISQFHDFVHFTQILGNGGLLGRVAKWSRAVTPETEVALRAKETLAAGNVVQGPVENVWRVRAVIAGPTPVFTFDLFADPEF